MSADKDILTKEIGSWAGFAYALLKENRTLFEEMSDGCKKTEYVDCAPPLKVRAFLQRLWFWL